METSELEAICRSALHELSGSFRDKEIVAEFYPYIGMSHTIRWRGSYWRIRISDHCRLAPPHVLRSIASLLACKVLRRKPPSEALQIYELYRRTPEVEQGVKTRRLQRGRKRIAGSRGRYYSLDEIASELNRRYFHDQVEVRKLGWGARRSWGRLGHYDPVHHTITISPVLDSPGVPRYAVSYLVYHEMLHTLFDSSRATMRERHHTAEFRTAEKAFPQYLEARGFLNRFCRTRGRSRFAE